MSENNKRPIWGFDSDQYGNAPIHAYEVYIGWGMWKTMERGRMREILIRMSRGSKYRPHQLAAIEQVLAQI